MRKAFWEQHFATLAKLLNLLPEVSLIDRLGAAKRLLLVQCWRERAVGNKCRLGALIMPAGSLR